MVRIENSVHHSKTASLCRESMMVGHRDSTVASFSSFMVGPGPDGNEVDEVDEWMGTGQADVSETDFGRMDGWMDEEGRQAEDGVEGSQEDASAGPQRRTTTHIEAGEEQIRRQDGCLDLPGRHFEISITDNSRTVPDGSHYRHDVKLLAACCNVVITCTLCHGGNKKASHFVEQEKSAAKVYCKQAQEVGRKSLNPARAVEDVVAYFCFVCRLYDSSSGTPVYHCYDCGICRMGKREEYFHCYNCNACVSIESRERHRCLPQSLCVDCPICNESLFRSTKPVMYMRCGHAMHVECWHVHTRTKNTCPFCQKSVNIMAPDHRGLDHLMVVEQANTPPEYPEEENRVLCNDCKRTSGERSHVERLRCNAVLDNGQRCGSSSTPAR